MAKVVLTIKSNNNKELKVKFAPVGHTPGANTTDDSFTASVDWGDGTTETVNSPNFNHTYTSGNKMRTITVVGGWGANEYLAFDKQSIDYVENLYVNPIRRSSIVIDNDTVNGDYINIKSHWADDFHGLNKTNTETIYIKSGITWKLKNKTGAQLSVSDGNTSNTIADKANKSITVPSSGTLTLTSGSVTQVIEIASNYKNNPKTIRNLWDKNTAVHMLVTSKLLRSDVYSPYQGGYTKEYKKIVIGGTTAKENNFVMHGFGDFAFFRELRVLDHVGTTAFFDDSTAIEYKPNLSGYKYTFAGCVQLRNGPPTSLVSKLADSPSDITGMFSGTSQSVTALTGQYGPIIAKKLSFEYLMILDRAFESSGYTAGLDGKLGQISNKTLESAIATFKGAKYAKGLWKLKDKLTKTARITDLLANNTNFDNASLKFLDTLDKVGAATIHKGGDVSDANMTDDVKRKSEALSVQTNEKPSWLKMYSYFFDGSVESYNTTRVTTMGTRSLHLVLPNFKIDATDSTFPSWFANAADNDDAMLTFMIIKKNYKGSLLALNSSSNNSIENLNAGRFIATGVASSNGSQITDFSMHSHQSSNLDIGTSLYYMKDIPSAQASAGGSWSIYANTNTSTPDYDDESGPLGQYYNATDKQWQGKLEVGGLIATKAGKVITGIRNTNTFASGHVFKDMSQVTGNQKLKDVVALWMSDQSTTENTYGAINTWDVSAITDMSSLFYNPSRNISNLNLTGWDTSSVTNMASMFGRVPQNNEKVQSLNISTWDVSNVTDMSGMFKCMASTAGLDITDWDVGNVQNFRYMFAWSTFRGGDLDFSNWVLNSSVGIGSSAGITAGDQSGLEDNGRIFKWKATYASDSYISSGNYFGEMPGSSGIGGIQENKVSEITAVQTDYITVSDGTDTFDVNKSGIRTVFEIVEDGTTYPTNYTSWGAADFIVEYIGMNSDGNVSDPGQSVYEKDVFEDWKGDGELELGMLFESNRYDDASESYLELRLPLEYKDGRATELYSS